jgi:hypothetical protein
VRGQYRVDDGALPEHPCDQLGGLVGINGTMLALHFSPDGKWLAGANRDRAGPHLAARARHAPVPHREALLRLRGRRT